MFQSRIVSLCILCLISLNVFADDHSVVFKGGDGVGKGKHIVFIASDHEYRSEEGLPALARIMADCTGSAAPRVLICGTLHLVGSVLATDPQDELKPA